MPQPYEIDPSEIEPLNQFQLVELFNRLLWHEGRGLGLPADRVLTTDRISDPDGAVDAITDAGDSEGLFIVRGLTAWQVKISWPPSLPELEKDLTRGKTAQDLFGRSAGYTLVVGAGMTPGLQTSRLVSLTEAVRRAGCTGPVRILAPDLLARWTTSIPAAAFAFRPQLHGYSRAAAMLRTPRHSVPYELDDARQETLDAITASLFGPSASAWRARIQGPAGVGKTRLALEIVERAGFGELTLYTDAFPSREFFVWAAANEDLTATVIVDECDEQEAAQLEIWAEPCGGRIRLITVGVGQGTGTSAFGLSPLAEPAMERVVEAAASGLMAEQVRWVAENTHGYVKLAVAVAQAIQRGALRITEMRSDSEIRGAVARLLMPSEDGNRALRGSSLLSRVGWADELAAEGEAIARFMGMDWNLMQDAIGPAIRDGLAVRKGRYLYVSPELLALWLAAEVWDTQSHRLPELLDNLPTQASRDSLLERLARLGDVPGVGDALGQLLGADGPFRTIDALDDDGVSRLFSTVAPGSPADALETLERLIGEASLDRLMEFKTGRRNVIWALEALVERRETFFRAARLLLRLGEAETESYANNASGVWTGLFLTFLGPTEVPALERLPLIDEALSSDRFETRLLAVGAMGSVLETREVGTPLSGGGHVPGARWRPQTWGEAREVKTAALDKLERISGDPDERVRREARHKFIRNARGLIRIGMKDQVLDRLERIDGETDEERRAIWEATMGVLKYENEHLEDEDKARLQDSAKRFFGDSLVDQIKRHSGPWSSVDWPGSDAPQELRPENLAADLADKAIEQPKALREVIPWLASAAAQRVWPFGHRLGLLDHEREWFTAVFDAVREGDNPRLLSAYMAGRLDDGDIEWVDVLLSEWSERQELAPLVVDASLVGPAGDNAANRLVQLVERGFVPPSTLGWVRYGRWADALSTEVLGMMIGRLTTEGSKESVEAALTLIQDRLEIPEMDDEDSFIGMAWQLLESSVSWVSDAMVSYHWAAIGQRLVVMDPSRMAETIAQMYLQGDALFHDDRLAVLRDALQLEPERAWARVGDLLLKDERAYRLLWELEYQGFLTSIPAGVLISWARQEGTPAAIIVAKAVKPGSETLEVVRFLLIEFGEATGGILATNFRSGSWVGNESSYLRGRLAEVQPWTQDPAPAFREWAMRLAEGLEQDLRRAELIEAEE